MFIAVLMERNRCCFLSYLSAVVVVVVSIANGNIANWALKQKPETINRKGGTVSE
jgi:hypothetical protein